MYTVPLPKWLFPGSAAVSSVSSFEDIKCEKVTTKLLPVHVLGELPSAKFQAVLGQTQRPHQFCRLPDLHIKES